MNTAIYPGSFDPITYGHLDVLETGAKIFDKVIIAVSYNCNKQGFIKPEIRKELIEKSVTHLENVEVDLFEGLTIEYARKHNATVLLRGLRAVSDFEYEMQLSQTNSSLAPEIKTVFLITKPEYSFISSSTVKEVFKNNGDITKFVPAPVKEYLTNTYIN